MDVLMFQAAWVLVIRYIHMQHSIIISEPSVDFSKNASSLWTSIVSKSTNQYLKN